MSAPVTLVLGGQKVVAPPRLFAQGLSMEPEDGELEPRGRRRADARGARAGDAHDRPRAARTPGSSYARASRASSRPRSASRSTRRRSRTGSPRSPYEQGAERRLALQGQGHASPTFTTADAKALKITERVSTFTTNFPYADYRNVNLPRAAELIDGTVLRPGETFSLNETVGERTKDNGFTEGYIVSDGIFKKDLGGGVSQIATTTFNAMFFAGLKDVEHKPHSVYIDRYPEGREATVAWPSVDLKFTNTTPYGVLIKADVRKSTPSRRRVRPRCRCTPPSTGGSPAATARAPTTGRPQVRYLQDADCEEASGTSGFSVERLPYLPRRSDLARCCARRSSTPTTSPATPSAAVRRRSRSRRTEAEAEAGAEQPRTDSGEEHGPHHQDRRRAAVAGGRGQRPGRRAGRGRAARAAGARGSPAPTTGRARRRKAHPHPVVIVHGTFGDSQNLLQRLTWSLDAAGYCVFALDYGNRGHRADRGVRRAAEGVRRPGAGRHRRGEGVDGRALPGRDDAALLHQVPRGSEQGRRPRRAGAVQPRHLQPAAAHARAWATCAPSCLQQKTGSAFLTPPQRGRRDARAGQLHQHRHALRRGGDPAHLRLPGRARTPPTCGSRTSAASTSPTTC